MEEFVARYRGPMFSYLRGLKKLDWNDAEEVVEDFICRIYVKRTIFQFQPGSHRFRRRLRTSLMNHAVDFIRRKSAENRKLRRYSEQFNGSPMIDDEVDPLEFGWAFSVLELAVDEYRSRKLGTEAAERRHISEQMKIRDQLDWEIFIRRYIGTPQDGMVPVYLTLDETARVLGVAPRSMKDRLSRIRKEFNECLKRVLKETLSSDTFSDRWNDMRFCLLLGNSQRVDLASIIPDFFQDPPMGSSGEFSIASLSHMERTSLEELVLIPSQKVEHDDLGRLWQRLLHSRSYSGECVSGAAGSKSRTLADLLFGPSVDRTSLERIKDMAKNRGEESHSSLKKLHHALYVLAIAVARNRLQLAISTFSCDDLASTSQRALRYDWLDDRSVREIETAVRYYQEQKKDGSGSDVPTPL